MQEKFKNNPYSVPEGYFDGLKKNLSGIVSNHESPAAGNQSQLWLQLKPIVTMAASFVAIVALGTAVLHFSAGDEIDNGEVGYEHYQRAGLFPLTDPEMAYYPQEQGSESVNYEDVAEYLIADGTTIEHIEYYEQN